MFKKFKTFLKVIEWIAFIVLLCLLFVVISPKLPFKNLPKSFVVVSGSMEPTIKTGSVAFTKTVDLKNIKSGDIIAFTSPSDSKDTILHRVNSISSIDPLLFKTKGDHNNDIDAWDVPDVGVKGVYFFAIPYLGTLAATLRQPWGFAMVVGLPAFIFIISQILNIKKAIDDEVNRKVSQRLQETGTTIEIKPKSSTHLKSLIFFFLFSTTILSINHLTKAKALYSDSVVVSGITISIADFTKPTTPTGLTWSNPDVTCGGYTNSSTITPNWDDSTDNKGILKYEYFITYPKIGGGFATWSTFVTPSQYTGVFNQGQGVHKFKVRAYDTDGNISDWSNECSITYDKTLPTSTITTPILNIEHNNDIYTTRASIKFWDKEIHGTAADNLSGVNRVVLSIHHIGLNLFDDLNEFWDSNQKKWIVGNESDNRVTTIGTENWSYKINGDIPYGFYKIVAHAIDNAGNIENSATIFFEYDPSPETTASNDFDITLSSDHTTHKINLKLDNICKPSDYEILYTGNGVEKGLVGKITADEIINSTYSKDFYLGICSTGGTCVVDNILPGSTITVNISGGQTLSKTFTY